MSTQSDFLPGTADHDIKDNNNLLNNNDTVQDVVVSVSEEQNIELQAKPNNSEELQDASALSGSQNLLNNDTVADITAQTGPVTEVTSIAAEEQKTGLKQNIPTPEELAARATGSFIRNIKLLNQLISGQNGGKYKISRKGMNRVLNSILQLPQDGMPVLLQGQEERAAFGIGQQIIADRFLITQHHINKEIKRIKEERAKQVAEQNSAKEGENNEQK